MTLGDELEFHDKIALCPETPVPESEIITVGLVPASVIVTLPIAGPRLDGANDTVTVSDAPGATDIPFEIPVIENPGPAIDTFETVTLELLVFVNVTPSVLVAPTFTLPKLRLDVLAFRPGIEALPERVTVPVHPDRLKLTKTRAAKTKRYG
jgi:hypothetical protein